MPLVPVPAGRLTIASHFPGRLRVRAGAFRDGAFGAEIAERLDKEPGVTSVEAVQKTGSLLVTYDAHQLQLPTLVQAIVKLAGLDGVEVDHDGKLIQPSGPAVRNTFDRWNRALMEASRGHVDAKVAMPGVLASLGVLKLLFGNRRLPEWYDLMFWSFTAFINLNPPEMVIANDGKSV
jgi:hypothetical protein